MSEFFDTLYTVWNQFIYTITHIGFFDILDILLIAIILYKAVEFLRETRAGQLVKGIVFLLVIYAFANAFNLAVMRWLLSAVFGSAIIALVVIFQPEIRRLLERVGQTKLSNLQSGNDNKQALIDSVAKICRAAGQMQKTKTGALIVFERKTQLGEIINTGTVLDAEVSESLVNNIFFPKSPLHDGAVIVRGNRVYAASCILPLTPNSSLSSNLGTRHRAAIGMTENSDAIVLIVSEETGTISIAFNGHITRNYTVESAFDEIKDKLIDENEQENDLFIKRITQKILPIFNKKKKEDEAIKEEEKNEI